MTRNQALKDYVDCSKLVDQLVDKMRNLEKIILGEVLPAQTVIPRHDRMPGNVRSNKSPRQASQNVVVRVMSEHGDKISVKDLTVLSGLHRSSVYNALSELSKKNLVRSEISSDSKFKEKLYSLVVHRDKSELNHL